MPELNNPKTIRAWCMYDWANSVYNLCITTAIFPIYYNAVSRSAAITRGADPAWEHYDVSIWGWEVSSAAAYSYTLSIAYLIVALISPLLSGMADFGGYKKRMLAAFATLGSVSCALMYFFTSENIEYGLSMFLFAAIGWAGSIIFYNSFLPEIATEDRFDEISARGFAYGYAGSVLLLIANLVMIMFPELLFDVSGKVDDLIAAGMESTAATDDALSYYKGMSTRYAFITVGIWWLGFSQLTLRRLPSEQALGKINGDLFKKGYRELKKVFLELQTQPKLKRYLLAFFFISAGLQTTMYLASIFGAEELQLSTDKLIITILLIQLIAIGGAFAFSKLSERFGNIYTLLGGTVIWVLICLAAATMVSTEYHFYVLAAIVGTVMGGMQALMRSTYAKLIPDATLNHASYFSFYDVTEKLAIVFGTFAFGYIIVLTGSMRNSAFALAAFFIVGLLVLRTIRNFKIHIG
ncbi:MAG: MFS transporter [Bacteroidia bacterium]